MKKTEKLKNSGTAKKIPPIRFSKESETEIKIIINKEIIAELSNLHDLELLNDVSARKGDPSSKGNTCTGNCNLSSKSICTKNEK